MYLLFYLQSKFLNVSFALYLNQMNDYTPWEYHVI